MRSALLVAILLGLPGVSAQSHHHEPHAEHGGHDAEPHHDETHAHDAAPHADAPEAVGTVSEALDAPPESAGATTAAPRAAAPVGTLALAGAGLLAGCALLAGYGGALVAAIRRAPWVLAFTRLRRRELLDHPARRSIHASVRVSPGTTTEEIATIARLSRSTAAYHLRVLEREGLVASRREGRVRRWSAPGAAAPPVALRHPTARALADAARASPGADQRSLAARLGISPTLAQWHLARLEAAGVVRKEREGRRVRYFV